MPIMSPCFGFVSTNDNTMYSLLVLKSRQLVTGVTEKTGRLAVATTRHVVYNKNQEKEVVATRIRLQKIMVVDGTVLSCCYGCLFRRRWRTTSLKRQKRVCVRAHPFLSCIHDELRGINTSPVDHIYYDRLGNPRFLVTSSTYISW